MIVSEITVQDLIIYLRLNGADIDANETEKIGEMLDSAKQWVQSYTGLTLDECDKYPDFVSAVYVLVQDMYDNRCFYVDKNFVNKVVKSILDMHSINYI
ncbi:MAG: phage gp6-like head-tail connector protein [Candidatus Improbicoccus devescovinae]|nr:MAG: phage gp6-like head-tail connector protein [Candidatus Improbicoccus devescovinae]